jgi:lipopolysaccharide assembly protein A
MKIFANFINSLVTAVWISTIALFSIQNIQAVSLKFLVWQSIQFPIGVLLAFCAGVGFIGGSLLPILWQRRSS